jgi:monoamine oxidase
MADKSSVDLIVIGAGSAGLAAGKTARELGLSVTVIEAAHRIGGRAFTDTETLGVPFDLGCRWMHSGSINPFVPICESFGLAYSKDGFNFPDDAGEDCYLGDHWTDAGEQAEARAAAIAYLGAAEAAGERGEDISVADVTERDGPWTPMLDHIMTLWTSHDADEISTLDVAHEIDTGEDWPVTDGYGALVARYGADLPVELNTRAERIEWSGPGVRVSTAKGTIEGRAALVTVSSSVLAAGGIRFDPALPDWKIEAANSLPLGLANRVALLFDGDILGDERPDGIAVHREGEVPISYSREGERLLVGHVGGRHAWWLENAGPAAMVDFAMEGLARALGSDVRKRLVNSTATAWGGDPFIRGSYSMALPGKADQRVKLAESLGDRLFFAGEATSPDTFATCHGAYQSGIAAAEAIASALGHGATRAVAGSDAS